MGVVKHLFVNSYLVLDSLSLEQLTLNIFILSMRNLNRFLYFFWDILFFNWKMHILVEKMRMTKLV